MIIHSTFKNYSLSICQQENFISELISDENGFFVVDSLVYDLYKENILSNIDSTKIILVEAIEENKTIDTVLNICEAMTKLPQKRNIHLISIGGGIIQDITGLVANILYRGIKWTFIPTTLLAACDSCIGGKTSLNYKNYKNLLGTFYPPDNIIVYPAFFRTLTERDFCSGLGEVVKFNVLRGKERIEQLKNDIDNLLNRDEVILEDYILSSLNFKKAFIEKDEFDRGIRINLNFAHTFGHAIESVSKYEVPHGTAVAMGMIVANSISVSRNIFDVSVQDAVEALVKKIIVIKYDFKNVEIADIIDAIRKDKKQVNDNITAILLDNNMELNRVNDITEKEIEDGFKYLMAFLEKIDYE